MKPQIVEATPEIHLRGMPTSQSVKHIVTLKIWMNRQKKTSLKGQQKVIICFQTKHFSIFIEYLQQSIQFFHLICVLDFFIYYSQEFRHACFICTQRDLNLRILLHKTYNLCFMSGYNPFRMGFQRYYCNLDEYLEYKFTTDMLVNSAGRVLSFLITKMIKNKGLSCISEYYFPKCTIYVLCLVIILQNWILAILFPFQKRKRCLYSTSKSIYYNCLLFG